MQPLTPLKLEPNDPGNSWLKFACTCVNMPAQQAAIESAPADWSDVFGMIYL